MASLLLRCTLLLLSLTTLISSVPVRLEERLAGLNVTLPSQDPFYQPTADYASQQPGTILKHRQIPVPLVIELLTPGVTSSVWQILYRSTDYSGNANVAVTTIFVPIDGDGNKLFTQALPYDAADNDCSPSYTLQTLSDTDPDIIAIALALYNGLYVQSPDFESTTAAFTNGVQSGQAMLDSLRAVLQSGSFTGVLSTARMALNGGSGGALGIEWAMELQSTYAPELSIAGVTLGSLTPNIEDVMNTINEGAFAGLTPTAILGLAQSIPAFNDYVNANLVPGTAASFRKAGTQCLSQSQDQFGGQNINSYFTNVNWQYDAVPQQVFQEVGIMGLHHTPQVPMYIYKGFNDEISNVDDTDALVTKYCNEGVDIVYVRDVLTGHQTESILGFLGAYEYILDRLNGVPVYEGCVIINSTKSALTNSDETLLGAVGQRIVSALNNTLPSLLTT